MEISYARCEQILNTLPIGYYTGRRIPTIMDKSAKTSFYSPMEDKIVVSYPIIAERLEDLPNGSDEEEAVRSMLYHEVSHAILTPHGMEPNVALNIFEDERIESVLRNYYHNVNFRKQLYDVHGGKPPKAVDTETAFFNAVRFGLGTGKVQTAVRELLNRYAHLNRNTPAYNRSSKKYQSYSEYECDVNRLWRMIAEEFKDDPASFQPPQGASGKQKQMDELKNDGGQGSSKNEPQGNNGEQEQESLGENGDENRNISDSRLDKEITAKDVKRMCGACLGNKPNLNKSDVRKLNDFQKTVEIIIGNFNKKNSGGSGINAYSGVFNPRAVTRPDYRYFDRAMSTQGNNKFGTCHLNLIIDCSGSFEPNENLTNGILAVLTDVERKNRNFSMDVVFINHQLKICKSVREREFVTYGGNKIPENMKEILLSLQKPQTCNYNIVLFDGDAMCNNCYNNMSSYQRAFKVFDMKQTTLITDPANEMYIDNGFTSTKVVITQNYTSELIKHITRALTIAFG